MSERDLIEKLDGEIAAVMWKSPLGVDRVALKDGHKELTCEPEALWPLTSVTYLLATIARLSEALAEAEKKGAENWQPIETAPKGRVPFLALNHDREVHVAAYDEHGRLMRRSHSAHRPQSFSIENGRKILLEETEEWRNDWVFWTRLYEFRPTHWRPLPAPPRDLSQGGQHG